MKTDKQSPYLSKQSISTQFQQISKAQKISKTLPSNTLSTKNLFTHYFLIHDFLFRLVKTQPKNAQFFDLQIDTNEAMRGAAKTGGKFGQLGMFALLTTYCLKGKTIKLKLFSGFLFIYWIDHFYTLGSYLGVLLRMPSAYKKAADYYLSHQQLNERNPFLKLNKQMETNLQYQQTQPLLDRIFEQKAMQSKSYVSNDYFAKNKDKYFTKEQGTLIQRPNLKLKYLDCFLTRYFYYTFTRWVNRKMVNYGLAQPQI